MLASTLELLRDILREAEFLSKEAAHTTEDGFLHDEVRKRAFVRSLEIIGEAARRVPADARAEHPALEWKKMAGMRDKIIHGYFMVTLLPKLPSIQSTDARSCAIARLVTKL